MAAILQAAGEVGYQWSLADDQLMWSGNAGAMFSNNLNGVPATGRSFAGLLDSTSQESPYGVIACSRDHDQGNGVAYALEYGLKASDGNVNWVEDIGRWYAGDDSRPARALGIIRSISARHEADKRLRYLCDHDHLTGTLNQARVRAMVEAEIIAMRQTRGSFAFLLASVDNLSTINSGYGFDVGDAALASVVQRLQRHLRTSDCMGRFTGNKFGILLRQCDASEMAIAAQRFIDCIRAEMIVTPLGPVTVSLSVGGVLGPRNAQGAGDILTEAHEALAQAKAKRRGLFVPYDPQTGRAGSRRADGRIGEDLVRALNERRVSLACQPIVRAGNREAYSYEALMRVEGTNGEPVPPGLIVPVAERLGLCGLLDHRVLHLSLELLERTTDLRLSLNISAQTTSDSGWLSTLASRLVNRNDIASRIMVEITESAAIQDIDESVRFLEQIKSLGCRVAIDDFGAGHTSFRYLRALKVDYVKIDGSYIQGLSESREDRVFVRNMIALARELGILTVAEWVDNEADASLLESWGIDFMQGHFFGEAKIFTEATLTPVLKIA